MDYNLKSKIITILKTIFLLGILITALAFFLNIKSFSKYTYILFGVTFAIGLIFVGAMFILFDEKERQTFMQDSYKQKNKQVNTNFEKVSGEKIIFPSTICTVKTTTTLSYREYIYACIVTNKRILFSTNASIVGMSDEEVFGDFNLWKSNVKINKPLQLRTREDYKIDEITCELNKEDPKLNLVKIKTQCPIGDTYFEIYHSNAKEIYRLFKN